MKDAARNTPPVSASDLAEAHHMDDALAVAAAASSGADKCLKVHMAAASRAGASQDEILDAVFIAAIIGQTRVLASALREFRDFEAKLEKQP